MGSDIVKEYQMGCQGSKQIRGTEQAAKKAFGRQPKSNKKPFHTIFQNLIKGIYRKETFYKKYQRMYLSNYSPQQGAQVTLLIKSWGQRSIQENFKFMEVQFHQYYKNVDMLSARVYGKFMELFGKLKDGEFKQLKRNDSKRVNQFFKQLTFSYNRYFFMKNDQKADNRLQQMSHYRQKNIQQANRTSQQSFSSQEIASQANNILTEQNIPTLTRMFHFMVSIELISLTKQRQISNKFMLNLERIKNKEQKLLYCKTMQFNVLQELLRAELSKMPLQKMAFLQRQLPNYFFYKTKINIQHSTKISLWDRYQQLIMDPVKNIQLLFPNHFQSLMNAKSSPLGYIQKRLFLIDEEVGLYLLISICEYFDQIGITLNLEDFKFHIRDKSRITKAFKDKITNYSAIMRILASLSITGFRQIAVRLINFLNLWFQKKVLPIDQNELAYLKLYSDKERERQLCFLEEESFPPAHLIFNKLKKVQFQDQQIVQQYYSIPQQEGCKKQDQKGRQENHNLTQPTDIVEKQSPRRAKLIRPLSNQPNITTNTRKLIFDSRLPRKLQLMAESINLDHDTVTKIHKNIIRDFTQSQKHQVFYLLKMWGNEKLNISNIDQLVKQQFIPYYMKCDILSARVYARAVQLIARLQDHKELDQIQQQNRELFKEIRNKKIAFSFDRYFFEKKQSPDKKEKSIFAKYLIRLINESKMQHFRQLFIFMQRIMLISTEPSGYVGNKFMKRLQNIADAQRKSMYFESIQFRQLQNIIEIHNENGFTSRKENMILQNLSINCPNYFFYKQEITSGKNKLHDLYGSYKVLESQHDYIQLMFPNHYQSAFNSKALPMSYLEKRFFLDEEMGLKMLVSTYIFFDFLGIRLDLNTFELSMYNEGLFRSAIVLNIHNHLRLMRILACLSIVGFRGIALKLIAFLDKNTQKGKIGEKYRSEFDKKWRIYGDEIAGIPKAEAKAMCFLEEQTFPEQHSIFKLAEQMGHI